MHFYEVTHPGGDVSLDGGRFECAPSALKDPDVEASRARLVDHAEFAGFPVRGQSPFTPRERDGPIRIVALGPRPADGSPACRVPTASPRAPRSTCAC